MRATRALAAAAAAAAAASAALPALAQKSSGFRRAAPLPEIDYVPGGRPSSAYEYFMDQTKIRGGYGGSSDSRYAMRQATTPAADGSGSACYTGSASTICLTHQGLANADAAAVARYLQAQAVFGEAAKAWADVFPSARQIRVLSQWEPLGSTTLGSAAPRALFWGGACGAERLGPSMYTPAVINSLLNVEFDDGMGPLDYHLTMTMNSDRTDWAFTTLGTAPPADKYDLLSTALHEMAHGLFFYSYVQGNTISGTAGFISGLGKEYNWPDGTFSAITHRTPTRFDRFLVSSSGASLVSQCGDEAAFYGSTTNGVRFSDPAATTPTNFGMFSPSAFIAGSSTSHFQEDASAVQADCTANGLVATDPNQCSQLMTPAQNPGQYDHAIGENTKRVMRAVMGPSPGDAATCKFNPWVTDF